MTFCRIQKSREGRVILEHLNRQNRSICTDKQQGDYPFEEKGSLFEVTGMHTFSYKQIYFQIVPLDNRVRKKHDI